MAAKKATTKAVTIAKKAGNTAVTATKKVASTAVKNPITTTYVVGGIVALVVGYKIYKAVTDKGGDNGVQLNLTYDPAKVTLDAAQATNIAAQLLNAMNRYGTNLDTVDAIFDKIITADDFKLVASKFGTRLYNGVGLPPEGLPSWLDGATPLNLIDWLIEEIGYYPRPSVYNKVKARVESAGFVFA